MSEKIVKLKEGEDYLTLNVLLKITGIISTGGQAKYYLQENEVYVNDILENRRGRKLYPGDLVRVNGMTYKVQ